MARRRNVVRVQPDYFVVFRLAGAVSHIKSHKVAVLVKLVYKRKTVLNFKYFSFVHILRKGIHRYFRRGFRAGLNQTVETLSGGNQQKVAVARWLTGDVDVLLLDEPTRGVDVGARSEIYRIITDFAEKGMAVVMASSDMPEILSLSHRAYVLRDGHFVGEMNAAELADPLAQDRIFRFASGTALSPTGSPASPTSEAEPIPEVEPTKARTQA